MNKELLDILDMLVLQAVQNSQDETFDPADTKDMAKRMAKFYAYSINEYVDWCRAEEVRAIRKQFHGKRFGISIFMDERIKELEQRKRMEL